MIAAIAIFPRVFLTRTKDLMKVVDGDLIQLVMAGSFDVIVHGCNCFCEMDAGIALSIKQQFPEAYTSDLATEKGAKTKLGTYSFANIQRNENQFTVINAYTQFHWRGTGVLVEYDAISQVFSEIKRNYTGNRIGYPKIGAGLAGGDWNKIATIIDQKLQGEDHTLVNFMPL